MLMGLHAGWPVPGGAHVRGAVRAERTEQPVGGEAGLEGFPEEVAFELGTEG